MIFRPYDHRRDFKAILRVWEETFFIDRDDEDDTKYLDLYLQSDSTRYLIAEINGEAECMVSSVPGSILHLETDVSMGIIASVNTSNIARKKGLASRLTAQCVAMDAEAGLATSSLGMFEQGYYSRLGFGTGPYEHTAQFSPAALNVSVKAAIPIRLTVDDYKEVHDAMMVRWRTHGGVLVYPQEHLQADMGWTASPFGLGYRNENGKLTHFIWGEAKKENGPYKILAIAYQNQAQLLELFALLKGLGDQVLVVEMIEPAHIQMQSMINAPFRRQNVSKGTAYEEKIYAEAYWQLRINDLAACLQNTHLADRKTLSFNLSLSDPISQYLEKDQSWQGIAGEYCIHLGEECEVESGHKSGLPLLKATAGGFSRLWLGCATASAISMTDEIQGSEKLLQQLENTLSLPLPHISWEF